MWAHVLTYLNRQRKHHQHGRRAAAKQGDLHSLSPQWGVASQAAAMMAAPQTNAMMAAADTRLSTCKKAKGG